MTAWSLPPATPFPANADLSLLFREWSAAKAWQWLRAGCVPLENAKIQEKIALMAFQELGIQSSHLSSAWHMRQGYLEPMWEVPLYGFPATPDEPWPAEALTLEGTSVGLLVALVANGWNPFCPLMPSHSTSPASSPLRNMWAIELVMGSLGQARVDPALRLGLLDQMMRSAHRPALDVLNARLTCGRKKGAPMPWVHAAVRSREVLAYRVCLAHGLDMDLQHDGRGPLEQTVVLSERALWSQKRLDNTLAVSTSPNRNRFRM